MKLLQLSDSERKKKMKMNIIRHRQKLLKYLENDLILKTKIINVDCKDVVDSNIFNELKNELPIKVEVIQELKPEEKLKCENADNDASVGSNSEWQSICQNENETLLDNKRRSSRLELVKKDIHHKHYTRNEDFVYNIDKAASKRNKPVRKKKNNKSRPKSDQSRRYLLTKNKLQNEDRFLGSRDRSIHNAKERACRERIASLFACLSKVCTYLDTNRRFPSKHSILLASKKECDLLKTFEKNLLTEKEQLIEENSKLKKRIKQLRNLDG